MKKEDRLLFLIKWIFYGIGGLWLANLILLAFFMSFMIDLIPSCGWAGWDFPYIDCGQSFYGQFLSFYFMKLSPFVGFFLLIISFSLLHSPYYPAFFTFPLAVFLVVLLILIYIVPFIIAYKIFKRLTWRRRDYNPQQRRASLICLCLILTPTFCVGLLKLYIEPPRFINRTITVDLWHSDLKIERRFLDKWTLVSLPRPEKELSPFEMHYMHGYKIFPFALLDVSYRDIDASFADDEKILITIKPHYEVLTERELLEKRQKHFDSELSQFTFGHKSSYKPAGRQMEFEVLEFTGQRSGQPDFYIHKNAEGKIENLLECTPDTHCITPFGRGYNQKPCENEAACKTCQRVCTDKSLGTGTLNIEYRFDKKYLDSYFVLHREILDFVAAHTVVKPAERFVIRSEDIVSWEDRDGLLFLDVDEEKQKKFYDLTKANLNKPVEIYFEDVLVGRPVIREVIRSGPGMAFSIDKEIKEKAVSALPTEKKKK